MATSDYLHRIRAKLGHDLVLFPSVTGAVFDDAGRILLLKHANAGVWVAPGGAVEPDETPADALVREVWEETGLWVEPLRLLGVFGGPEFQVHYANGDDAAYVMTVFECRQRGGLLTPDGVEALELRFVSEADLGTLALSPWARIVIPAVIRRGEHPGFSSPHWTPDMKRDRP